VTATRRYTDHARDRMAERNISEADVESALRRRSGEARVGRNGKVVVFGYATAGRILKLVLTSDQKEVVTLAWPDE
jgi:hypothetical protein